MRGGIGQIQETIEKCGFLIASNRHERGAMRVGHGLCMQGGFGRIQQVIEKHGFLIAPGWSSPRARLLRHGFSEEERVIDNQTGPRPT